MLARWSATSFVTRSTASAYDSTSTVSVPVLITFAGVGRCEGTGGAPASVETAIWTGAIAKAISPASEIDPSVSSILKSYATIVSLTPSPSESTTMSSTLEDAPPRARVASSSQTMTSALLLFFFKPRTEDSRPALRARDACAGGVASDMFQAASDHTPDPSRSYAAFTRDDVATPMTRLIA